MYCGFFKLLSITAHRAVYRIFAAQHDNIVSSAVDNCTRPCFFFFRSKSIINLATTPFENHRCSILNPCRTHGCCRSAVETNGSSNDDDIILSLSRRTSLSQARSTIMFRRPISYCSRVFRCLALITARELRIRTNLIFRGCPA